MKTYLKDLYDLAKPAFAEVVEVATKSVETVV